MGSGKSTVGKELAKRLKWSYVDLDELIVSRSGLDIPEIFRRYGEPTFRSLESSALVSTLNLKQIVVATGGGAPCYNDNLYTIKGEENSTQKKQKDTRIVFLNGSVDILIERISADTSERPIVKSKSPNVLSSFVTEHLSERMPYYEQADVIVQINQSVSTVVDEILEKILEVR